MLSDRGQRHNHIFRRLAHALLCFSIVLAVLAPCMTGAWEGPAFQDAVFHPDAAYVDGNVRLDLSCTYEGYMAVSVYAQNRLKCQVLKDETTYTYDIHSDGTPSILPLQSGSGIYQVRILENVQDTKYAMLYSCEIQVEVDDEFQPYLRPNDYASYREDSDCIRKAEELAAPCESALDVVTAIYDYITSNIVYDQEKAATVQSGYLPVPDETLATGKGICFDYASLAAAMLRSQGIPAKVIFGYVSPGDLYHAWNMFYTEQTGWVTVDYHVSGNDWNRLDLTFAANGADSTFIGDGSNYSDLYYY